ncbi:uncharacterized protein LOC131021813 isoform X1 [Salvia miltiorrhiza]|uniref:uncharacterized protein LOC131021813 isoform X1 n=1 Tax=Salvia miltiorrhiza TaxID=226208 RepID=UPI0025AD5675|nr:uncharacterized protein LOC131021813 isoform X1 [Salvia miltiorrhiza]
MVNDSADLHFISALRSFNHRVVYANANYDHVVGWRTSSIRRQNELPKESLHVNDMKYPHIVHVEQGITEDVNNKVSSAVGTQVIDLEESISCLEELVYIFLDIGRFNMSARYYKFDVFQLSLCVHAYEFLSREEDQDGDVTFKKGGRSRWR